jgi:hypothetical protein
MQYEQVARIKLVIFCSSGFMAGSLFKLKTSSLNITMIKIGFPTIPYGIFARQKRFYCTFSGLNCLTGMNLKDINNLYLPMVTIKTVYHRAWTLTMIWTNLIEEMGLSGSKRIPTSGPPHFYQIYAVKNSGNSLLSDSEIRSIYMLDHSGYGRH